MLQRVVFLTTCSLTTSGKPNTYTATECKIPSPTLKTQLASFDYLSCSSITSISSCSLLTARLPRQRKGPQSHSIFYYRVVSVYTFLSFSEKPISYFARSAKKCQIPELFVDYLADVYTFAAEDFRKATCIVRLVPQFFFCKTVIPSIFLLSLLYEIIIINSLKLIYQINSCSYHRLQLFAVKISDQITNTAHEHNFIWVKQQPQIITQLLGKNIQQQQKIQPLKHDSLMPTKQYLLLNANSPKQQYIISIQNITAHMKKTHILEQYPHLQSEWLPVNTHNQQTYYKHAYSDDQSEVINLKSVSMKEVDIYSAREAYSFPFCPRIYKYVIQQNYQERNQLCFDIVVLYQKVDSRLCQNFLLNATNQQIKFLTSKVNQIVKGFQYLYRRFGGFQITQKMIGWTQLGIIKVWLNEDFFSNTKSNSSVSQQSMIKSLLTIVQENTMCKNKSFKKCTTFQTLLSSLSYSDQRKSIQIANSTLSDLNYNPRHSRKQTQNQQVKSVKTRKNITFSYSNKDLNRKSTRDTKVANKKCSILMSHQDQSNMLKYLAQNNIQSQVADMTPPSSLKVIHPLERRTNKKKPSQFMLGDGQEKYYNQNLIQLEKQEDSFSKTTVSYRKFNCNFDLQSILKHQNKVRPENLHYSTSSNPLAKFLNVSMASNKAYSTKGNKPNYYVLEKPKKEIFDNNLSDLSAKDFRQRMEQNFEVLPVKIEQKEQETNMRQSQQIQRDLDALFHSDHEFDYNELENELDCIF